MLLHTLIIGGGDAQGGGWGGGGARSGALMHIDFGGPRVERGHTRAGRPTRPIMRVSDM
jgi:hypothetical protein